MKKHAYALCYLIWLELKKSFLGVKFKEEIINYIKKKLLSAQVRFILENYQRGNIKNLSQTTLFNLKKIDKGAIPKDYDNLLNALTADKNLLRYFNKTIFDSFFSNPKKRKL